MEREWGVPSEEELTHSTVIHQLQVTLGIAKPAAERLLELATRLVAVLPDTLAAVEAGRIDLARAEVLAQETAMLDDAGARAVQALVLAKVADADGPWQTLSPRGWKAQIQRLVIRVDNDSARRRREAAIRRPGGARLAAGDGTGVLQVIGQDSDIAFADAVITNLALAGPDVGPDGVKLSMDQRRVDGFMDLMRRVAFGDHLPQARAGRDREVGSSCTRTPSSATAPPRTPPASCAAWAPPPPSTPTPQPNWPAPSSTPAPPPASCSSTLRALQRTLRLPTAPPGGWTRDLLVGQVRAALSDLPDLQTESYEPTVAITEHVRAVHPRCTSYDCARLASRCDLDHDESWPRGPTCVTNLCPRCRRHHELKTRGLVHTRLHPDGSVTTTTLLGTTVTTRPEPVPGHGPGEAYAILHSA